MQKIPNSSVLYQWSYISFKLCQQNVYGTSKMPIRWLHFHHWKYYFFYKSDCCFPANQNFCPSPLLFLIQIECSFSASQNAVFKPIRMPLSNQSEYCFQNNIHWICRVFHQTKYFSVSRRTKHRPVLTWKTQKIIIIWWLSKGNTYIQSNFIITKTSLRWFCIHTAVTNAET